MVWTEETRLVRYLLYLCHNCVSDRFRNDFIHEEWLQISEAGQKQ